VSTKTSSLLLVGAPDPSRDALAHLLTEAGYSLTTADSRRRRLSQSAERAAGPAADLRRGGERLVQRSDRRRPIARRGHADSRSVRRQRRGPAARKPSIWGADDVVPVPWTEGGCWARVRAQLRQKNTVEKLEQKTRIAEESFDVAQTAFQALAVTEKMTRDAFSLERILKIGVLSLFGLALIISGVFFLYSRRADKETKRAYGEVAQLEHSIQTEAQLLASARRLRDDPSNSDMLQQKEQLQKQSEDLKKKLARAE